MSGEPNYKATGVHRVEARDSSKCFIMHTLTYTLTNNYPHLNVHGAEVEISRCKSRILCL